MIVRDREKKSKSMQDDLMRDFQCDTYFKKKFNKYTLTYWSF